MKIRRMNSDVLRPDGVDGLLAKKKKKKKVMVEKSWLLRIRWWCFRDALVWVTFQLAYKTMTEDEKIRLVFEGLSAEEPIEGNIDNTPDHVKELTILKVLFWFARLLGIVTWRICRELW